MFEKTESISFLVKDMSCNHCVSRITDALKKSKGIKKFSVSLDTKTVCLNYAPSIISIEEVKTIFTSLGFNPEL